MNTVVALAAAQQQARVVASSPVGDSLGLSPIDFPTQSQTFTAGQAEAVATAEKAWGDAVLAVREHAGSVFDTAAAHASEVPAGLRDSKRKQLGQAQADLAVLEASIAGSVRGDEEDVAVQKPKTTTDYAELAFVCTASLALAGISVYANRTFLAGSAIFSGAAAWGVALLPMVAAFYAKDPLSSLASDLARRRLRHTYTCLAVLAILVWISTFGHEAGAPVQTLNDLSGGVPAQSNTLAYTMRAIAQVIAEMFGGAVLFHRALEIARNEGAGKAIKKVYTPRDKYTQEVKERDEKRLTIIMLEHHLQEIEKWFAAIPAARAAYVAKAVAQFERNLTAIKE